MRNPQVKLGDEGLRMELASAELAQSRKSYLVGGNATKRFSQLVRRCLVFCDVNLSCKKAAISTR